MDDAFREAFADAFVDAFADEFADAQENGAELLTLGSKFGNFHFARAIGIQ